MFSRYFERNKLGIPKTSFKKFMELFRAVEFTKTSMIKLDKFM